MSDPKYKEILELLLKAIRWSGIAVGGLCLMIYSQEIGQFPEGMGLGEGLAFYLVCMGFGVLYLFYLLSVTCIGMIVWRWPMIWVNRLIHSMRRKRYEVISTNFSEMWNPGVWAIAGVGVLIVFVIAGFSVGALVVHGSIALLQGFAVGMCFVVQRSVRLNETGLVVAASSSSNIADRIRLGRKLVVGMTFVILLAPLLLMPKHGSFVDAAFRFAQLRKEHAIVHIRKPWSERLLNMGLPDRPSYLGADYVQFEDVTVLLRSVGTKIVLEVSAGQGKSQKPSFPADAVYVE